MCQIISFWWEFDDNLIPMQKENWREIKDMKLRIKLKTELKIKNLVTAPLQ